MTFPSPGPATQSTGNVAGGPYGAWSGTQTSALIGPAGILVPFGGGGVALSGGASSQNTGTVVFSNANNITFGLNAGTMTASVVGGGVALYDGANSISSGTALFSNVNGVTFGINGQTITASVAAIGGAQTGISSIADSAHTQTVGMLSFANSQGVTFGLSTGAATATLTASVASQTVQTQTAGNIAQTGFATTTTNGVVVVGTNQGGITLAVPPYITTWTVPTVTNSSWSVSDAATSGTVGRLAFTNLNGITLSLSTGAGGSHTIVGSYTVPTVPALSAGVSTGGNTLGNTGTYSGQVVFAGGNNITLSVGTAAGGAQTITISGANAGGAQTGISAIVVSNTTYTSGTVSFSNLNGISFGSVNATAISASYTVPATAGLISGTFSAYAQSNTTQSTSGTFPYNSFQFAGAGNVSVGISNGSVVISGATAAGATSGAAYLQGNTTGQSSSSTYALSSLNVSGAGIISAGWSNSTLIISSPATTALAALTGAADSANTQTTGLISFANSNGITFGLSTGANTGTITASYSQSNQAFSAQGGSSAFQTLNFTNSNNVSFSNTGGSVWGSYALNVSATGGTSNALSGLTFKDGNGVSFGLSTGVGIGTITASIAAAGGAQTGISSIAASGGTQTVGMVSFINSNNVTFGMSTGANTGSMTASYALNVSATGGTSNALSGLTFKDGGGVSFGLSTGAGIGTLTASVSQTVQTQTSGQIGASTGGIYLQGNTSNSSSGTWAISSMNFSGLGAITLATSASSVQFQVPQTSSLVGTSGLSVSTNGSTISVYPIAVSTYVPYWPASTSSLLLNVLGVSSANPVFFPFQVVDALSFNMIAVLQSYSFVPATLSAASATEGVRFGLYSNNASTWSQISSGSSSVGITNSGISVTISYGTATSTSGYGYGTTSSSITLGIESFFGTVGFRNPIMQFGGNMTLTPGWYAVGLVSTASSSSTNIGINQALIGNVVPISSMFGMGQSTTVTNQMLGMGYGTATTSGLPASMAFSNMTNSLGIIPIITIMST